MRPDLAFVGTSHAAVHLAAAAREKGFRLCIPQEADLVFVSEDTPTDAKGIRDLDLIRALVWCARNATSAPIVLTSAVPPGFTRSLGMPDIIHQAETLRIKDAEERARNPEMLIVGTREAICQLPEAYGEYLTAFRCPILRMTWEEAEFAKVAINACLAAQVDCTNRLSRAAARVGAGWEPIAEVLAYDSRIGPRSYLTPGRWQDSRHLWRDDVTLREIEA